MYKANEVNPMKTLHVFTILIFLSIATGYNETRHLNIATGAITLININCGAGFLKITGDPNADKIEVIADINVEGYNLKESLNIAEDYLELTLKKRGKRIVLVSRFIDYRKDFSFSFFKWLFHGGKSGQTRVNLTVVIPENIAVMIDDGSGFIDVKNIHSGMELEDGSGSITLKNMSGSIIIDDGSGSIQGVNIIGKIDIDDGSGSILLSDIDGDIIIDDGSGGIELSDITGNIRLWDGSGDINIRRVKGNVTIVDDGSGDVDIRKVEGEINRMD